MHSLGNFLFYLIAKLMHMPIHNEQRPLPNYDSTCDGDHFPIIVDIDATYTGTWKPNLDYHIIENCH